MCLWSFLCFVQLAHLCMYLACAELTSCLGSLASFDTEPLPTCLEECQPRDGLQSRPAGYVQRRGKRNKQGSRKRCAAGARPSRPFNRCRPSPPHLACQRCTRLADQTLLPKPGPFRQSSNSGDEKLPCGHRPGLPFVDGASLMTVTTLAWPLRERHRSPLL